MSDDRKRIVMSGGDAVCVLALSIHQSAALNALLGMLNNVAPGDPFALFADQLLELRPYLGPAGVYCSGNQGACEESPSAARMLRMLGELPEEVPKNTADATADPVDVVQQALDKAAGSKVIPVDFKPKPKE